MCCLMFAVYIVYFNHIWSWLLWKSIVIWRFSGWSHRFSFVHQPLSPKILRNSCFGRIPYEPMNHSWLVANDWCRPRYPSAFGILLELEPSTFATGYVPAEYLKKVMGLGCIAENVPRVHVICRYFQMSSMFPTFFHHPKWCLGPWHFRKIACKPKPFTALKDPRHFHDTICPATSFGWLLAMRIK